MVSFFDPLLSIVAHCIITIPCILTINYAWIKHKIKLEEVDKSEISFDYYNYSTLILSNFYGVF